MNIHAGSPGTARFESATVVVRGGNKGIGLAIARRFGSEGANRVLASVEDSIEQVADDLRSNDIETLPVVCDVTSVSAFAELYAKTEETFGPVDISVQNAGIITNAKIEDLTERPWDDTMDVNTKGVFLCCQEAIRHMRRSGNRGRLINTASGQARDGFMGGEHSNETSRNRKRRSWTRRLPCRCGRQLHNRTNHQRRRWTNHVLSTCLV